MGATAATGDVAYLTGWLRQVGAALLKGERQDVTLLDDGRARIMLEYPSMGELLEAVMHLDALRAMIREDAADQAGRDERRAS
jgi:hypothetical protein